MAKDRFEIDRVGAFQCDFNEEWDGRAYACHNSSVVMSRNLKTGHRRFACEQHAINLGETITLGHSDDLPDKRGEYLR